MHLLDVWGKLGESSRQSYNSYNIEGKIKDRENSKRNMVLPLLVDESREERGFYCAVPSTKNIVSAQDVGQRTRKKSMNSRTSQNQGKLSSS